MYIFQQGKERILFAEFLGELSLPRNYVCLLINDLPEPALEDIIELRVNVTKPHHSRLQEKSWRQTDL